mgnify:CR=1 FL=1
MTNRNIPKIPREAALGDVGIILGVDISIWEWQYIDNINKINVLNKRSIIF